MQTQSCALRYAAAAAVLTVTLSTVAHAQTQPRYRHSVKRPPYDTRGGYYPGAPQPCAPFSRDKMDEAIIYGDSKFLTCGSY